MDRIPLTGRNPARIETSRSMMRAWAAFAREGDPGWERWAPEGQPHPFGTPYGPGLHLPPDTAIRAPVR